MASQQDTQPISDALKRLLARFEERRIDVLRRETSYLVYDFDVNSSELTSFHKTLLDDFIAFLDLHRRSQIVSIIGRASQTGPEPNNQDLSQRRAEAVKAYLVAADTPPDIIGPIVASGSTLPVVNAAGREQAMNRSVEIICDWQIELQDVPPTVDSSRLSTRWNLNLGATIGGGAVFVVGQIQLGTLTNKATGESRAVQAFLLGPELAKSVGPTVAVSASVPPHDTGDFETPFAVDFNYFDGFPIIVVSAGGAAGGGLSATRLWFRHGGSNDPSVVFTNLDAGLTVGLGGAALFGVMNVVDH